MAKGMEEILILRHDLIKCVVMIEKIACQRGKHGSSKENFEKHAKKDIKLK